MPGAKKTKKSSLQQKGPVGLLKKHKRVRQSEKVIKEGKNIRVDDDGVEDFDDYFTKSNLVSDLSTSGTKTVELNKTLKTSLPCKHISLRFKVNSDDSNIPGSFENDNSLTRTSKSLANPESIAKIICNYNKSLSTSVSLKNQMQNNGVEKNSVATKKTLTSLPKNGTPLNNNPKNKKHKRKRKDEEAIKQGKIIRTDEDGIELFDDYFTKSTIMADSNEANEILKRSKSTTNMSSSRESGSLLDQKSADETLMCNGLSPPKKKKSHEAKATNTALNSDHISDETKTLSKISCEKSPRERQETTKKSAIEDNTATVKKIINQKPAMTKKISRKRKPKTELEKCEFLNQKSQQCLDDAQLKLSFTSSAAKLNGLMDKTSLSTSDGKKSTVGHHSNGLPNKHATSPCRVTVINLCQSQSFVDRIESCKVNLFSNFSPGRSKKADPNSPHKEIQSQNVDTESKKNQNLEQNDNSECERSSTTNSYIQVSEELQHNALISTIKHCSSVRLEIENLSPEKISQISNSPDKVPNDNSSNKSKVSRVLQLNEIEDRGEDDFASVISRTLVSESQNDDLNTNKSSQMESKKLKNSKGGKHFLPKGNFVRERRSSSTGKKNCSEESDSDDASESDGHIYIPSKPSKPQIKRMSTGDPEDLAVPSTSRWKPIIKRTKKVKPKKIFDSAPEIKQRLSTISEINEMMINSNSPKFQPRVSLEKLDLKSAIYKHGLKKIKDKKSVVLNQKQLTSALKGTRKNKSRMSVSFKELESFSSNENQLDLVKSSSSNGGFQLDLPENFLPLHTPPIHTPNVRRSRRKKIPRLNYGLNQKVIYQKRPSGGFSAVGIDLGCTPELPHKPRPLQGQPKKKQLDSDSTLSIHHPSVINPEINSSYPRVLDNITHQEVPYEMFRKGKDLIWFGPTSQKAQDQDPFIMAKPLKDSSDFFGFLKLRGNSEKPFSYSSNDTMTFIVTKGKVSVEIHDFQMVMEKGDVFAIPKGNSYKLTNLRDDEATFIFITK